MKKIALCLFFLLNVTCILAQEKGVLKGKIIDDRTHKGLLGISVFLENTTIGTSTNAKGTFYLSNIPEGKYTLVVSSIGYERVLKKVYVRNKQVQTFTFPIKESTSDLDEVIVKSSNHKAEIKKVLESPMSVSVVDGIKLRGRAGGIEEILTKTSGLKIRKTGGMGSASKISIHGLEGKRIAVFINGFPLNSPDGSFDINDIPIDLIKRIEVYKGIVPAEFGGDGLGGAINVVTREDETDLIGFTQEVSSYESFKTLIGLKKMFEKSGIQLGIGAFYNTSQNNYKMTYPIYDVDLPKNQYRKVTRNNDYYSSKMINVSLVFTKLWFDKIEIECPVYENKKGIQALNFDSQAAHTHGTNIMPNFSLEKENFFVEGLSFKMSGVIPIINTHLVDTSKTIKQWNGDINNSKGETADLLLNNSNDKQKEIRIKTNISYKINTQHLININNQFAFSDFKPEDIYMAEYLGYDPSNFPSDMKSNIVGFTHEFFSKNKKWSNQLGINFFYLNSQITNNEKLSGSSTQKLIPPKTGVSEFYYGFSEGITYKIKNGLRLKASFSKGIRLPDTQELFGDGINIRSSINLKPEQSYNVSMGFLLNKTNILGLNRVQFDANLFYTSINDMITIFPADTRTVYVNLGKAAIMGIDADIKVDISSEWYAYYNITYQDIRDKLKWKTSDKSIENTTYNKPIPNIPRFFYNYGLEYHTEGLLGKDELFRAYIDGSYMGNFNWNFQLSKRADERKKWEIPASHTLTIGVQQSFWKNRISLAAEIENIFDNEVFMEFKRPLPGRVFKVKLRFNLFKDEYVGGAMGY